MEELEAGRIIGSYRVMALRWLTGFYYADNPGCIALLAHKKYKWLPVIAQLVAPAGRRPDNLSVLVKKVEGVGEVEKKGGGGQRKGKSSKKKNEWGRARMLSWRGLIRKSWSASATASTFRRRMRNSAIPSSVAKPALRRTSGSTSTRSSSTGNEGKLIMAGRLGEGKLVMAGRLGEGMVGQMAGRLGEGKLVMAGRLGEGKLVMAGRLGEGAERSAP